MGMKKVLAILGLGAVAGAAIYACNKMTKEEKETIILKIRRRPEEPCECGCEGECASECECEPGCECGCHEEPVQEMENPVEAEEATEEEVPAEEK